MKAAPELSLLELVCFGPPTARLAGREPPPDVLWRKHLGVLIYLALSSNRTKSREHLLGVFWPEKPVRKARHSLNEAVRRLRAGLGADRLQKRGDAITLNDAALEVDVLQFEALTDRRLETAAALVRGDFLEGFAVEDAPAFEEWADQERIRWRARGAAAFLAVAEQALSAGRLAEALEAELRALALEPHSEPAARLRLRTLALLGDSAGALAWYHEFTERLAADLGERPGRDLEALAERIRTHSWRRVAAPPAEALVPLVGDEDLQRRAFGVISDALSGAPRTLVIVGEQGFGKTRMIQECLGRAALEGAVAVAATPLEQDHDAPWSTLRALARAGLTSAPGAAATDPAALDVLAAVIPELSEHTRRAPVDRGEVAAALARLLAAAAEERPLVLAVDDAHFADGATLEGLAAAMAAVAHTPVALVISCFPAADRGPAALTRLRSEVGRRLLGDSVHLAALTSPDVRRMVEALAPWCSEEDRRERLTRRLMFESGGSAFLAVALLQALARASTMREDVLAWPPPGRTTEESLPISVPDLVKMAVVARVSALEPDDLHLVRAASVAGPGLDPEVLACTSGLSPEAVEEGLVRLERAGLVTSDGRRYAFAAPLIAEVVAGACLTSGQRRTLRLKTAQALSARPEMDARVLRVELLSRIGPDDAVFAEAVVIAEEALAVGAVRSARRALAAAEQAAGDTTAARERLAALRRRLDDAA
jgi:DNA-binding SARP family transcriptional activator